MSKLLMKGNASGTGRLILESPDTNDDITLQFPSQSGTVATLNGSGMPVMSDGTPVVESGKNSDGRWVKMADGTLLMDFNYHAVYRSTNNPRYFTSPWNFPHPVNLNGNSISLSPCLRPPSQTDPNYEFSSDTGVSSIGWGPACWGSLSTNTVHVGIHSTTDAISGSKVFMSLQVQARWKD
ncbi:MULTISPECIES: hypothetical protein [Halomonas]|uniref:hypothetical protein n=1 Tax=Halomonas TaxID=2745 RepID=UPI001C94ECEB|nr:MULTISPECIES: hypothetical protein [Halomonas]MBY6209090.1 hypothetical protein [Halomonas sp. DP3Y7-2]MBY6229246.1 hypothetical protein [Halomonas sp. DP3Y7-1]MCA0917691.1 hypothetical protein [Halomonas denitrificans]